MAEVRIDEIGPWSEVKLDIVKDYATAYTTVVSKQSIIRGHTYIDGFAGAGQHISKSTREMVAGSPLNALLVKPPFKEFHFIDLNGGRAQLLRQMAGSRKDVWIYEGDCNEILLKHVFPRVRFSDFRRALCLLDPYGLQLKWEVLAAAGKEKSIEIFLNFPIMDMNRNVLLHDPSKVPDDQIKRMNSFWGDDSWRQNAYVNSNGLFGEDLLDKTTNQAIVAAFRKRLKDVAGFAFVPEPLAMRNRIGSTVYYLFFASPNKIGAKIVKEIFDKHRS
jgi:three-Cys-motif partner protein